MTRIEKSIFIIKPEALRNSLLIKKKIKNAGLEIINSEKVLLTKSIITDLYPDIKSDLLEAHIAHLCSTYCEVGVVKGPDAIKKLLLIAGENTNPSDCQTGTIRAIFGDKKAILFGSAIYYKNAFHRPKNYEEAKTNFKLFGIKEKSTTANKSIAASGAGRSKHRH